MQGMACARCVSTRANTMPTNSGPMKSRRRHLASSCTPNSYLVQHFSEAFNVAPYTSGIGSTSWHEIWLMTCHSAETQGAVCYNILQYHHTVQVAQVQVQYLHQWLDEKAPPAQDAKSDTTMCASGAICTSGCIKRHHQRKLQLVTTTT